jgi:hypothetical protein
MLIDQVRLTPSAMAKVIDLPISDWNPRSPPSVQERALRALEEGNVLLFPQLGFSVSETEAALFSRTTVTKGKNLSLDMTTATLRGSAVTEAVGGPVLAMMQRFVKYSEELTLNLLPHYRPGLALGRTSFRPVSIAGRATSWRKDDTRLHIDSFPSSPTQGKRILRLFSNVDPEGRSRSWRLGEPFENIANRYLQSLSAPAWGSSRVLRLLRITKSRRSAYDHFMLQLHDRMKADLEYQSGPHQSAYDFPAGSTWMAFTDQVAHAAMTGQHLLEQTFYLPVRSMMDESKSPLRILERLSGQQLT